MQCTTYHESPGQALSVGVSPTVSTGLSLWQEEHR